MKSLQPNKQLVEKLSNTCQIVEMENITSFDARKKALNFFCDIKY